MKNSKNIKRFSFFRKVLFKAINGVFVKQMKVLQAFEEFGLDSKNIVKDVLNKSIVLKEKSYKKV